MAENIAESEAPVHLDDTSRMEAFSDGVFGVAITLLVLNIQVPLSKDLQPNHTTLLQALLDQWPAYLSYVTSFLTIGIVWANHHATFNMIRRSDHGLRMSNLFLLMTVTLIPFTTALLAEYIKASEGQRTAAAVYSFGWLLLAIAYNLLWRYASRHDLLEQTVTEAMVHTADRRMVIGLTFYVIALLAALISAVLSVMICIALALFYLRNPDVTLRAKL